KGVERTRRIHDGRTCVDAHGNAQRLRYFFLTCAQLASRRYVDGNTPVAPQADGDAKSDQLACLAVEMTGFGSGTTKRYVAFYCIWTKFSELSNTGHDLLPVRIPVEHVHGKPLGFIGNTASPSVPNRSECPSRPCQSTFKQASLMPASRTVDQTDSQSLPTRVHVSSRPLLLRSASNSIELSQARPAR